MSGGLNLPTLDQLRLQARAGFAARLPGADTTLRFSTIGVLSDVVAAMIFGDYRSANWWSLQLFVSSMQNEYLDRAGAWFGLTRNQASFAAGNAEFSGTNAIPIPIDTPLRNSTSTAFYATQAAGTIASGTATIAVEATTPGAVGNAAASAPLTITSAIAGIMPTAAVDASGLTGGADQESDDAFRARILARMQEPPHGGAWFDYVAWAKLVPGVTRAWCYPLMNGPGTVGVTFMMDGRTNPIPLSADLTAVTNAINTGIAVLGAAPVTINGTANLQVFAPTASTLNLTIANLVSIDPTAQADINAQLAALIATIAPGGAVYGDGVTAAAPGGYLYLSQIEAAIEASGGVQHFDLTAPSVDQTYGAGVVPGLGTVTYA